MLGVSRCAAGCLGAERSAACFGVLLGPLALHLQFAGASFTTYTGHIVAPPSVSLRTNFVNGLKCLAGIDSDFYFDNCEQYGAAVLISELLVYVLACAGLQVALHYVMAHSEREAVVHYSLLGGLALAYLFFQIPFTANSLLQVSMLCYAMLCYGMGSLLQSMLCYAMLRYAVLCFAMLCCAMLCYGLVWDALAYLFFHIPFTANSMLQVSMLCYAMLCYDMLCFAMLCRAMLSCAMLSYGMGCACLPLLPNTIHRRLAATGVLGHAMLGCAMLCYAMLCYAVLCYDMVWDALAYLFFQIPFTADSLPQISDWCLSREVLVGAFMVVGGLVLCQQQEVEESDTVDIWNQFLPE
eukprot:g81521.t1